MSKYYEKHRNVRTLNLLMGPALFLLCLVMLPHSVFTTAASRGAVGTVVWMAYWWVSGPIDFAITGFLPIAVNAFLQMADMAAVIANYADEIVLLLLGASILTAVWEMTGLDKRIASWLWSTFCTCCFSAGRMRPSADPEIILRCSTARWER
jgi:sodium-dependent dicarboxylate transporter 2/3/5